jgi:enoyl-CoA hydratase
MAVSLEIQDDIAILTIDDGAKNVINHGLLDQLEQAWEQAQRDARVIILTGREGSFCAGYDIHQMTGDDPEPARKLGRRGGRLALQIYASARPVIGLANGHTFTIGALWLACCDVRIGEEGAYKFGMTEVALDVPFSPWPLEPLKERLNPGHLIPATLHAKVYDPKGALAAGFIDQLVGAGSGLPTAVKEARQLVRLPSAAYARSKRTLRAKSLEIMAADLDVPVPTALPPALGQ